MVHQHGGSIRNSVKLCDVLWQITQKQCTTDLRLAKRWFMHWSSTTFHVLGLFHFTASKLLLIFLWRVSENYLFLNWVVFFKSEVHVFEEYK